MVVIGSSFISMELVAAVSKRKLASIDVIGMEQTPFEAVLGKEVGAGIQKVWALCFGTFPVELCFAYFASITNPRVSCFTRGARLTR